MMVLCLVYKPGSWSSWWVTCQRSHHQWLVEQGCQPIIPSVGVLSLSCLLSWSLSPLLLASFFAWFRALALPLTLYAFSDTDVLRYERESNCPWRMKLREDVGVSSACCACCFLLHVGSLSPLSLLSSFCLGKWKKKVNKMHLYRYCDSELALIRNKNFLSTRYVVSNIDLYTHWQWKVFLGAESLYWLRPNYTFLFLPKLFPNCIFLCTCKSSHVFLYKLLIGSGTWEGHSQQL